MTLTGVCVGGPKHNERFVWDQPAFLYPVNEQPQSFGTDCPEQVEFRNYKYTFHTTSEGGMWLGEDVELTYAFVWFAVSRALGRTLDKWTIG